MERIIEIALQEDLGHGDITTEAIIDPEARTSVRLVSRERIVLAGCDIFHRVIRHLDHEAVFAYRAGDGDIVPAGAVIAEVTARTESLFKGERTALNFMQRLCGVATRTRLFLDRLQGLPVTLLDTRKTTPGMRPLEKYAVRVAGAGNHRFGLFDGILIKDNHRAVISDLAAAVAKLRRLYPWRRVEIECGSLDEVREAMAAGAEILMLDNMTPEVMAEAVRLVNKKCLLEASGNISLDTIRDIALTGVDYISAGSIIHGAVFVDLSLEVISC